MNPFQYPTWMKHWKALEPVLGDVIETIDSSPSLSQKLMHRCRTKPCPTLPIEVWERVIDFLGDPDQDTETYNVNDTLTRTSLVCKAWVARSQWILRQNPHIREVEQLSLAVPIFRTWSRSSSTLTLSLPEEFICSTPVRLPEFWRAISVLRISDIDFMLSHSNFISTLSTLESYSVSLRLRIYACGPSTSQVLVFRGLMDLSDFEEDVLSPAKTNLSNSNILTSFIHTSTKTLTHFFVFIQPHNTAYISQFLRHCTALVSLHVVLKEYVSDNLDLSHNHNLQQLLFSINPEPTLSTVIKSIDTIKSTKITKIGLSFTFLPSSYQQETDIRRPTRRQQQLDSRRIGFEPEKTYPTEDIDSLSENLSSRWTHRIKNKIDSCLLFESSEIGGCSSDKDGLES
ncbi:hypothetical protein ABKN59_001177 [Abortiporus biennis]